MSLGFSLLLEPPTSAFDLGSKVAGLNVPLRLALTAQAAGASAIVLSPAAENLRDLLADPRLSLPVVSEAEHNKPSDEALLCVPANLVVHRGLFQAARDELVPGERRQLLEKPVAFDPPFGFTPLLVTDRASAAQAEKALLRSLRKPQDGWTSTYLNRHISLFCTRLLVRTPLRPNQVSVGILGIGLFGAWLASQGTYLSMLVGAFCFQMQSVLDGCDGEMSRLTFRGSKLGEWLDTVGDDLTNYGFFAGAAWGLYTATGSPLYLALGGIVLACGITGSAIEYAYLIRIGSGDLLKYPLGVGKAEGGGKATSKLGKLTDLISPLFKRDTFVLLTLFGAALGLLGPFLAIFAAGAIGVLVAIIKAEIRMAKERRALRAA